MVAVAIEIGSAHLVAMVTLSTTHRDAVAMGLASCVAMVTPSPAHRDAVAMGLALPL